MDNTQELYHYGIPGMRWGRKRGKQDYATLSKSRTKTKNKSETKAETKTKIKAKPKLSKGKKVAIGTTVAAATLAGIGALAAKDTIGRNARVLMIARAAAKNL